MYMNDNVSVLLVLREGKPAVADGFPSQRASNSQPREQSHLSNKSHDMTL